LENKSTATIPQHIPVNAHHVLAPSKTLTMHFGAQTLTGDGGELKHYYGIVLAADATYLKRYLLDNVHIIDELTFNEILSIA
jgi:hypothetical protein